MSARVSSKRGLVRHDDVLDDVLLRYDRLMDGEEGKIRPSRNSARSSKSHRKPQKEESFTDDSSSVTTSRSQSKSSRKARTWLTMLRTVSNELRDAMMDCCRDFRSALKIVNSNVQWHDLMEDLQRNSSARDDFVMLLQMMEDRGAAINSASLRRIAIDVGSHHLRRMLHVSGANNNISILGEPSGHRSHSVGRNEYPLPELPAAMPLIGDVELGLMQAPPSTDLYSGLKHGIDRIQDANKQLNYQNLTNAVRKSNAEQTLFKELMKRNEDLKDTSEDVKIERMRLAKENEEYRRQIETLQYDLKISTEVADAQSKKTRETEEATKKELESLDAGIRELEMKLSELSKQNAVLSEEKESYKGHNEALLKEVERQDKVIRRLGRQVDSYSAISTDFQSIIEPLFKLVRGLKERLDEYDVMRERLNNNIRDIRDDKEYAYRVGDLVVEMTTSRLWRIMEQYTDNNGRLHSHVEELQDMTRHLDKALDALKEDVHELNG